MEKPLSFMKINFLGILRNCFGKIYDFLMKAFVFAMKSGKFLRALRIVLRGFIVAL